MAYEAVERIGLPVWEQESPTAPEFVRGTLFKEPGDTITKKEFEAAKQTPEDIENLLTNGAIKEVGK